MSDRAQAMLFEAFARSFFAQPGALSAGELIAMFHYYFLGNPEGIGFDAPDTDYLTCIWAPFAAYLDKHGAVVRTATPARAIAPAEGTAGGSGPTTARSRRGTSCSPPSPAPCATCSPPPPTPRSPHRGSRPRPRRSRWRRRSR